MPEPVQNIFQQVMERVRLVKPEAMRGWFRALEPIAFAAGVLAIRTGNAAQKEYLERYCQGMFTEAAQAVTGRLVTVEFEHHAAEKTSSQKPARADEFLRSSALDRHCTFDSFAVGPCNRLAHAAIEAVRDAPGEVYNPLFVWGPEASGKTHLLQALAHACLRDKTGGEESGSIQAWYVTAPGLINQLMLSVEQHRADRLRQHAGRMTMLVLDDVDGFANRERSQEEFFHLLNHLVQNRQQVVVSGDRPPGQLAGLHDRLRTRFEAGLVVGLDPPCPETRAEIVRAQARARCIEVATDVTRLMAERIESPRALVATLVRLDATSQMRGEPISAALLSEVLEEKENTNESAR